MTMTCREAAEWIRDHDENYDWEDMCTTHPEDIPKHQEAFNMGRQALERVARLEELLVEATKEAGQHHDHFQACQEWAFGAVLDFIRTGEEWS